MSYRTTSLVLKMSKLGDLPIGVTQQLCKHLNLEGAGVKNWKDLVAQAPGELEGRKWGGVRVWRGLITQAPERE